MNDATDKASDRARCTRCGTVDTPRLAGAGPGGIAIALWVGAALLWGLGYVLGVAWTVWAAAVVLLAALVYTLRYFARRERACRHCGAPMEAVEGAGSG